MALAKHREIRRRDAARRGDAAPDFSGWAWRSQTWDTVSLVLFAVGAVVGLVTLSCVTSTDDAAAQPLMDWLSDHIVLTMVLGLAITLLAATAVYRYLLRRSQDTQRPANPLLTGVFTVTVGGLVALVFGVFVNGLLAHKRDREGRIWSARQQHLARLQPILRADAETFALLSKRAVEQGFSIDPRALGRGMTNDYQKAWQSDNPLTPDLPNHFREYAEARRQLVAAVESHDGAFNAAFEETLRQLVPVLTFPGGREQVAGTLLSRCVGLEAAVSCEVSGGGYSYSYRAGSSGGSGSGTGPPPPECRANARAFRSFSPSAELKGACEKLRVDAARVAASTTELGRRARELSERTVLPGRCQFVELVE